MTIVGVEMVKRDRESFDWWWPQHLRELAELCDALYVRADPSSDIESLTAVAREALADTACDLTITSQFVEYGRFQEDAERQELLSWAFGQRAAWAACFDADEVLEPGGGQALRSLLMHRVMRQRRVVRVQLNYASHHRPGYVLPRSGINPFRVFRLDSHSRRYTYASDRDGLHCGSVPAPGVGAVTVPDLRVIHYHATSCEEFMAERAFYDNTIEVDQNGGIDWLYRCDRFGDEAEAVPLEQKLAGAKERLTRIALGKGMTR